MSNLPIIFFGAHFWRGESGKQYMFSCALTKDGIPENSGGIYVFVKRHWGLFLQPLYVGKAANLRGRLVGHEKWGKAWWILGATERHVMRVHGEMERRQIEEDLIRGLKPRMNDMQVPRNVDDMPTTPALAAKWKFHRAMTNWLRSIVGLKPIEHVRGAGNPKDGYFDPSAHKRYEFARHR